MVAQKRVLRECCNESGWNPGEYSGGTNSYAAAVDVDVEEVAVGR